MHPGVQSGAPAGLAAAGASKLFERDTWRAMREVRAQLRARALRLCARPAGPHEERALGAARPTDRWWATTSAAAATRSRRCCMRAGPRCRCSCTPSSAAAVWLSIAPGLSDAGGRARCSASCAGKAELEVAQSGQRRPDPVRQPAGKDLARAALDHRGQAAAVDGPVSGGDLGHRGGAGACRAHRRRLRRRGAAVPQRARHGRALLAQTKRAVGLDTGFSHLAAALGLPTIGIYCDHEPGLAGIVGTGGVASVGGKGQVPSLAEVLALVERQRVPQAQA